MSAELDEITSKLSADDRTTEQSKRNAVLQALNRYTISRYDFGKALAEYKQTFGAERTWMQASKAIAKHMGRSPRTVFRILEDYQRVANAPKPVIDAMKTEGYDPAEPKHAPILSQVSEMASPDSTPEQVGEAVRRSAAYLKQDKAKVPMSEDDRIVWGLRLDIRKRLNNVSNPDAKWALLERAIAEEAFEVWGETEAWECVITPKPGPRTLDGRARQPQEVAA